MRAMIQRVSEASVQVGGETIGVIGKGLLVFLGVEPSDTEEDINWLAKKVVNMRIFSDEEGVMNRSVLDEQAAILLVSQSTLHASTKKGNRPSFIRAAKPPQAKTCYELFQKALEQHLQKPVATGQFGANMQVQLINDGPVSIWMDTKNKE